MDHPSGRPPDIIIGHFYYPRGSRPARLCSFEYRLTEIETQSPGSIYFGEITHTSYELKVSSLLYGVLCRQGLRGDIAIVIDNDEFIDVVYRCADDESYAVFMLRFGDCL